MSDTSTNPAEPTENQGGGTTTSPTVAPTGTTTVDETDAAAAEPTENQGGGSD